MSVTASLQPSNLEKVLRELDVGMFGVQLINSFANGWRNFLKKGILDKMNKIVEGELVKLNKNLN